MGPVGPAFPPTFPIQARGRATPTLPAQPLANHMNLCSMALTILSLRRGPSNQGCPPLGFLRVEEV